jgi:CDP-glucose 4,6-dehydratase
MGMRLQPEVRNETSNEIRHQVLSAAKARREFGWRPRFSLDEGLQIAVSWYREILRARAIPAAVARTNNRRALA